MGRSDTRKLDSRLIVLMMHLLKWKYQPEKRSRSWKCTIQEQRTRLSISLKRNPSLKYELEKRIKNIYGDAVSRAIDETALKHSIFPETCPFTLADLLNENTFLK